MKSDDILVTIHSQVNSKLENTNNRHSRCKLDGVVVSEPSSVMGTGTIFQGISVDFRFENERYGSSTTGLHQQFEQIIRCAFYQMFDKILEIGKLLLIHLSKLNSIAGFVRPYLPNWQIHAEIFDG